MLRVVTLVSSLCAAAAWAQGDARAEVRSALEEKAPVPAKRLRLPAAADLEPGPPFQANKTARDRATNEAARATALTRLPSAARDPRASLGSAGQSAEGQARAEEAKKNSRANKPPRPPP